jgi:hypothetical protein
MTALHATGRRGGWPLTMFLLPDGRPFHGGTYLPPLDRDGRLGFASLLDRVALAWRERRPEVEAQAGNLANILAREFGEQPAAAPLAGALDAAFAQLVREHDAEHGGFGGAPKFPQPERIGLLLRHAHRHGCRSVTIDFTATTTRDHPKVPRGRRGRRLRATVAGIPTARFRDRLVQMAANAGLWVIAVDPAYTSKWGRTLVAQLDLQTPDHAAVSVHDGAAVMIGRRGLGHDRVPVSRTPGPSPADDGRATADTHGPRSRRPRPRATGREPPIVKRRRRGTRNPDVARSRQHRSGGTPPASATADADRHR